MYKTYLGGCPAKLCIAPHASGLIHSELYIQLKVVQTIRIISSASNSAALYISSNQTALGDHVIPLLCASWQLCAAAAFFTSYHYLTVILNVRVIPYN